MSSQSYLKRSLGLPLLSIVLIAVSAYAADDISNLEKNWLHIYAPEGITRFHAFPYSEIDGFSFSKEGSTADDLYTSMQIHLNNNMTQSVEIPLNEIERMELAQDLPLVSIHLNDYPDVEELWDKELYLDATVDIDGAGVFEDVTGWATSIKGRGNSTWLREKKPYRFKGSKKISLLGMKKAKSYALIANYLDSSHMKNFVSLALARYLGLQFTNSCIPCRVRLNDIDKGLYFLTEKIGINGASVDIDENQGWLLELDLNYDEKYRFYSKNITLPVMLKDPDIDEVFEDPAARWGVIKDDFNALMLQLKNCKDESWRDFIDVESLCRFMIVNNFARNMELRHPKSVYIYKPSLDDKYYFGPVWDFDWAYTFGDEGESSVDPSGPLLVESGSYGTRFFYIVAHLPGFMEEFVAQWDEMVEDIYPQLLDDMKEYAVRILPAAKSDAIIWPNKGGIPSSFDLESRHQHLKKWIEDRIIAASESPTRLLY